MCVCVRPPGRGQGALSGSPPCRRGGYLLGRERRRGSPRCGAAPVSAPLPRCGAGGGRGALRGGGEVRPFPPIPPPHPQTALRPAQPAPAHSAPRRPRPSGARAPLCCAQPGGHGQRQPGERERPRCCSRQLTAGKWKALQLSARSTPVSPWSLIYTWLWQPLRWGFPPRPTSFFFFFLYFFSSPPTSLPEAM